MEDYIKYLRSLIGHGHCLSVGLSALIIDEKGRVLLEKRTDNDLYCLPGGSLDYEEKLIDGISREVKEETGLSIKDFSLFMIQSGPETTFRYPNGDITNYVDFVFLTHSESKNLSQKHDEESSDVFFCPLEELPPKEKLLPSASAILAKYLSGDVHVTID